MQMQIDVPKLVGAASAPVALIIATSIFLGNLGGKYAMLAGSFRQISEEYRKSDDKNSLRSRSLIEQLGICSGRLRLLMHATFWLGVSILCFIATVVCTSISVLMPKAMAWTFLTAVFSFAGMLILAASVAIEILENSRAKRMLVLETAEFSDVLSEDLEEEKRQFRGETGLGRMRKAEGSD
jgi:Protein of unknown function (DUF2721)